MRSPVALVVCGSAMTALLTAGWAGANDGRDRYAISGPNLFRHLNEPVSDGAGFCVLPSDMEGGADGDPAYRWAQTHALAVVEVAAYRTLEALGPAAYPPAIFDLSAENGDTPVDFGSRGPGAALPDPPRGRHPGGSHDGGLNLDLGYYLTDIAGKLGEDDYAACTEHFHTSERDEEGKPVDLNMCDGPADRLDVERQAFFFLQLLQLHRRAFGGGLLEEVGVDRFVLEAVRAKLVSWKDDARHGVTATELRDLDTIMTSDRWGGWQRFHHHHTHVRIQAFDPYGPLRDTVRAIEIEARRIRSSLLARRHGDWPAILDATLLSYRLERAVEVHVAARLGDDRPIERIRYRIEGGTWQTPDDPRDDQRYVFDIPNAIQSFATDVTIEAEVTLAGSEPAIVDACVHLPRRDPRLSIGVRDGDITGTAKVNEKEIRLALSYPDPMRALITSVTYLIYPDGGAEPERHVVAAGWFASSKKPDVPEHGTYAETKVRELPLLLPRTHEAAPIALIEARVLLSSRYAVRLPLYVENTR